MPITNFMIRYYRTAQDLNGPYSVLRTILKISLVFIAISLSGILFSCKKEILSIGSDILPNSDFVSVVSVDTLSPFSFTEYDDSVRTDNPSLSYLGTTFDPYFGTTTAGFVSQIRLVAPWKGAAAVTVDSVKLFLRILTSTGGTPDVFHSISIYEISDQLYNDTAYYSNTPLHFGKLKLANITLPTLVKDTLNDIGLTLPRNGIDFGNYLLRDTSMLFYSNNVSDFRSYFKGLYFEMDPNSDPLLLSLSLVSNQTTYYNYFMLYGHTADGTTTEYSFALDSKNPNACYNRFDHNYSTATLGDKMVHRNTAYRDTVSYLQSLNGVYTRITLPGLAKLKAEGTLAKMAINRARLVVPFKFNKTLYTFYKNSLPATLRLRYKPTSTTRSDVPDYSLASSLDITHNFFSGAMDSVNNVYNFNIPDFVQAYLKDATNKIQPELEIYQPSGLENLIFRANGNKTPVKFEFTYTKF